MYDILTTPIPACRSLVPVAKARPRKPRPAADLTRPADRLRVVELRELVKARGLRVTTKHTRSELLAMLTTGQQLRPAANDRQNARRAAKH